MSVLVRVGVDICIQLSTVSSCLAGQVNNNNNMLSNELEGKKERENNNKNRGHCVSLLQSTACTATLGPKWSDGIFSLVFLYNTYMTYDLYNVQVTLCTVYAKIPSDQVEKLKYIIGVQNSSCDSKVAWAVLITVKRTLLYTS